MGAVVFIGDELTATGLRLTGIETVTPPPNAAGEALEQATRHAALIIMTADLARHVAAPVLEAALLAERPVFAVIPDILLRTPPPNLTGKVRRILGIEE